MGEAELNVSATALKALAVLDLMGEQRRPVSVAEVVEATGADRATAYRMLMTLVQAGYAPLGMVMGTCVYHIAHQRFWQAMNNIGQNVELPQFTEALYDARELALSRMQAEAERVRATGITGVDWTASEWTWGTHTLEFFTSGTAVRKEASTEATFDPQIVLPLR